MADAEQARPRRRRGHIEALDDARAHLGRGDNNGESGDGPAAGAGGESGSESHDPGDGVERGQIDRALAEQAEVTGDGTGEALPAIGDGGARERKHTAAMDRHANIVDDLQLDTTGLVFDIRDFLLDLYRTRPMPWSQMAQGEQRDLAAAAEQTAKELVRKTVEVIASDDRASIRALLESYSEKDGLKASLKIKTFSEEESLAAVIGLHQAVGKHVMITVASADDYMDGEREASTEPDQPALAFEAGSDEHPEDDSDLAGERTRRNLESGMLERHIGGGADDDDSNWADVRALTPDEIDALRAGVEPA